MNALQAIATLTDRQESEIASFDTWAHILLVRFTTGSPRFVSFKKFAALLAAAPKPLELTIQAGRKGARPWVAMIQGLDSKFGLKRKFIDGAITWSPRNGAEFGEFSIATPGLYQSGTAGSSSDDYFLVKSIGGALEYRDISWQEAKDIARSYDAVMELLAV
jgi:hypothetical protein